MSPDPEPHAGHRAGDREFRRVLLAMFLAGFATWVQLFDVQSVLTELSRRFELEPSTAALTVSASSAGIAVGVLPWSVIADRVGRVPAMKISVLAAAAVGLLSPLAPTFELLVASRFALGVTLAAVPAVAMAYLAEEIHRRHLPLTAGLFISGNSVGAMAGRLVSGGLVGIDLRLALVAPAALALALALVFLLVVPPARGFRPGTGIRPRALPGTIARLLRDPALVAMYVTVIFSIGVLAAVYNFVAYHLEAPPFGLSPEVVSLVFVIYLCGGAATPVAGWIAGRRGRVPVLFGAFACTATGAGVSLIPTVPTVLIGVALITIGCFTVQSTITGWVGERATTGRAQATALYQLATQTGVAVIGWAIGIPFGAAGWPGAIIGVYATIAVATGFTAAVLVRAERRGGESAHDPRG